MIVTTAAAELDVRMANGVYTVKKTKDTSGGRSKKPVGTVWTGKSIEGTKMGAYMILRDVKGGEELLKTDMVKSVSGSF